MPWRGGPATVRGMGEEEDLVAAPEGAAADELERQRRRSTYEELMARQRAAAVTPDVDGEEPAYEQGFRG